MRLLIALVLVVLGAVPVTAPGTTGAFGDALAEVSTATATGQVTGSPIVVNVDT